MITKEWLKHFEASSAVRLDANMISISLCGRQRRKMKHREPLSLLLRKHHILNHLGLHGHIGESLKEDT